MHLMFYLDDAGKRVYTLKARARGARDAAEGRPRRTSDALGAPGYVGVVARVRGRSGWAVLGHTAARFSPDDKFSSQRIAGKKRFGLLLTQQPPLAI
jgi:rRNA maturation protein Nop10